MYSPITLDALRTLDAIDRRLSFAAAADELFRVSSAVSYTISKLEEDLGIELFSLCSAANAMVVSYHVSPDLPLISGDDGALVGKWPHFKADG